MKLRIGYDVTFDCPQGAPMILMLNVHYSRASDIVVPDHLSTEPSLPIQGYRDGFGNWCNRILAPPGQTRLTARGVVRDTGQPDPIVADAPQHAVEDLPEEALVFLLNSRYCETDLLTPVAWNLFGGTPPGWARVQAICDYVHNHITFGYEHARVTKTAFEGFNERAGVCRDFTHLAVAFCRGMNIPARYCTGYLGDIGVPVVGEMDYSAWMEVYLGGRWHTFDPRNNEPRIGRVLIARGRDASDVAIATTFGPNFLQGFTVVCDEVDENVGPQGPAG